MKNKNVGKLVLCFLLLLIGIWTESFLPFLFILLCLDFFRNRPYSKQFRDFVRVKAQRWYKWIEWFVAILLSVWFVAFVQDNFVGIYTFQTSSMHQSLQVGDVLLVNKLVPGARKDEGNVRSYSRSKGTKSLTYKDVVMFNFPEGDTLLKNRPTESYYYLKRLYGDERIQIEPEQWRNIEYRKVSDRPRFVKRIYGLPGDTIALKEGQVYANNNHINYPPLSIGRYIIEESQRQNILDLNITPYNKHKTNDKVIWELLDEDVKALMEKGIYLKPDYMLKNLPDAMIFPFSSHLLWNMHHMGLIYIPKKGDIIELNDLNFKMYKRIIKVFEQNSLIKEGDNIYINDKLAKNYTFKMNYYWVLGDNRPHSFDSRFWGFLPEDHIIGKVNRILLSRDINSKNWIHLRKNRFLKEVN